MKTLTLTCKARMMRASYLPKDRARLLLQSDGTPEELENALATAYQEDILALRKMFLAGKKCPDCVSKDQKLC